MITRLEVDGFKSLRDFAIDFEPFTVLIGPNSAGKSNVLEALGLLSRLCHEPIEAAFKGGRGRAVDQFTLQRGEPVRSIRFAVELLLPVDVDVGGQPANRLRYEISISRERQPRGTEALVVDHERLTTIDQQHDRWAAERPVLAASCHHGPPHDFHAGLPVSTAKGRLQGEARPWLEDLASLRLVHLDAARLTDESERIGTAVLAPDASNLPTVLASLSARAIGEIRADLVAVVPGISTFDVVAERDTFHLEFELSGGDRLPARLVSDGTLRALALLTALRSRPAAPVIAIEEPENGIYPGRLRTLLDLLREASEPTDTAPEPGSTAEGGVSDEEDGAAAPQILITSHSPVVLATLRDDPGCLRFIDVVRREGRLSTRARRVGQAASGERGAVVPVREVDALLSLARTEAAE